MVSRPVFGVALIVPAPTNDTTPVTAGSRSTISRHLGLQRGQARDGDALRRLGHRDQHAGILLRQKPLRHDDIEPDRADQRRRADQQHQALVPQRPVQACGDSRASSASKPASADARDAARVLLASPGAACRPHIIGVRVSETTADTTTATDSVTENSLNSRPTTPVMNSSGMNTAISDTVSDTMVKPICAAPR